LYRQYGDAYGEACTLDSLGHLAHAAGLLGEAVGYYRQSLAQLNSIGNSSHQADGLARLGDAYADLGQRACALEAWEQAGDLYLAQHRAREASRVHSKMAGLKQTSGSELRCRQ
jgi:tetratricopeptide (TPR) repeat protein